jgi:hypothetical protein
LPSPGAKPVVGEGRPKLASTVPVRVPRETVVGVVKGKT